MSDKTIIGAYADIVWEDQDKDMGVYFSFGKYDEENDCDSYGINEEAIFFYTDKQEFQRFLNGDQSEGFKIVAHTYRYEGE